MKTRYHLSSGFVSLSLLSCMTAVSHAVTPLVEQRSAALKNFVIEQPAVKLDLGTSRSPEVVTMIRNVRQAVGRVNVFRDGQQSGHGTGFLLSNTELVTNDHVVKGADSATFVLGEEVYNVKGIIKFHPTRDQVVLTLDRAIDKKVAVNKDAPELAESVWVIGSPLGYDGTVSDGIVSGVRGDLLQITAPINPGNSGGPIFSRSGSVLGVATYSLREAQNMNFGYRLLDDGWVNFKAAITLAEFKQRRILDGQKVSFPLMREKVLKAVSSLLARYEAEDHAIEVLNVQKITNADIQEISELLVKRDAAAANSLRDLATILAQPEKDHGELLITTSLKVLLKNDDVILWLCELHGLPPDNIKKIREAGGTIALPADNWDRVIALIGGQSLPDAALVRDLVICNFVVCLAFPDTDEAK